jgi:hypothetical protein
MRTLQILIAALLLTASLVGCKRIQEKRIIGEWTVENLRRNDVPGKWIFYDNNTVDIINDDNALNDTLHGEYGIKSKMQNYVYIDCGSSYDRLLNGKFYIEKMKKNKMILTRREYLTGEKGGAFLQREFYK